VRIGIYIPNRNDADVLRRALTCATTQGADDVLVVDDASEDNSLEVVREFPGVRVIEHPQKTPDHIEALADIVSEMPVDYVIGMGADDYLLQGAVSAIREETSRRLPKSRPGVVFTDYAIVADDGGIYGYRVSGFSSPTFLSAPSACERLAAQATGLFECGVGAAVSMEAHRWQVRCGAWRMGSWGDSIGNSIAACVFGASYLPIVGAGFTVASDGSNWHTTVHNDPALSAKYRQAVRDFVGHDEVVAAVPRAAVEAIVSRWGG
jgi:glycosyltransferase involved in cell wall biosynthesis